ncbi:hypothetical protein EYF80_020476 [Liparis tanakae]|uniref:Uncharacterized protein n=1 Tax=Liparis tanakae TaxID=230148 RepID=A0A4Z2HVK9_9TELE|nr:hypothetical protein EYF80_020476 [Liparis tanakae]
MDRVTPALLLTHAQSRSGSDIVGGDALRSLGLQRSLGLVATDMEVDMRDALEHMGTLRMRHMRETMMMAIRAAAQITTATRVRDLLGTHRNSSGVHVVPVQARSMHGRCK